MQQPSVEDLFKITASVNESRFFWLGPTLSSTILQRHNDYVHCISSFGKSVKVLPNAVSRNGELKSSSMLT